MKTKTNPAMGGGANASKKLLAAVAVLAVAFVVLAAIPAANAADGDVQTTNVAKIGDKEYPTLEDAMDESNSAKDDHVTVQILGVAVWNDGWEYNSKDYTFIGADDNAEIQSEYTDDGGKGWTQVGKENGTVTFQNLTLSKVDGKWIGDAGHRNDYFGVYRGAATVNYIDCKFPQGAFSSGNTTNFNDCVFIGEPGKYGLWMYGNTICTVTDCTFDGPRGIKLYSEGIGDMASCEDSDNVLSVSGTNFGSPTEKLPIELSVARSITLGAGNTYPSTGVISMDTGNDSKSSGTTFAGEPVPCQVGDGNGGILVDSKLYKDYADARTMVDSISTFTVMPEAEIKISGQNAVQSVVLSKDSGITLTKDTEFNGSISYTGADGVSSATMKVKAGDAGISIRACSVEITGEWAASDVANQISAATGNVILKDLKITNGTLEINGDVKIQGTVTIEAGAGIKINSNATVTVGKNATLSVAGEVTGAIANTGTVESLNGGNLNGADITGTGKVTSRIDDSGKGNVNIAGTISGTENERDADQIVTIVGDSKLDEGAVLTINGILVIEEGVTLTLSTGSVLNLATGAVMIVQGTVVVEEGYDGDDAALINAYGNVKVYGTMDLDGALALISGNLVVEQDGVLNVLSEGSITTNDSQIRISVLSSGTLNIAGAADVKKVKNAGTVVIDSEVLFTKNVSITMENGAVLNVRNIILGANTSFGVTDGKNTVTVTDVVVSPTLESGAVFAAVSGLQFGETIKLSKDDKDQTVYTYDLAVSGDVTVKPVFIGSENDTEPTTMTASVSVVLTGSIEEKSGISVADGFVVGEEVTLENSGKLVIKAGIDASSGAIANNGTLDVAGGGSIVTNKDGIANGANTIINAAKYETGTGDAKRMYYVTLDVAIAAAASGTTKGITVLGEQTLEASAVLVAGATMDVSGAEIVIGSGKDAKDVELRIASGATVKGDASKIAVDGTVYAEKKTDLKNNVRTKLDEGANVYTEEVDERNRPASNGWAKWTNIYTAMADPEVTVVKLKNELVLEQSLTIPEGKTLDTNTKEVTPGKNVVLTVEGTFFINGSDVTLTTVAASTTSTDKSASIVVEGLVKSDAAIDIKTSGSSTDGIVLLGAYYMLDGEYCLTTVEKAAAIISTVDEQTVIIKGESTDKLTVAEDIIFAGKSAEDPAIVAVNTIEGIAFSGFVSIDNASILVASGMEISGTFTNGAGSVALKGKTVATAGSTSALTVASETKDGNTVLTVSGKLVDVPKTGTVDKIKQTFTVTGTVTVNAIDLNKAVIDGTLTVEGVSEITTLTVNGSVVIATDSSLSTTTATILGTLTASEKTSSASDAVFIVVGTLYIGTTADAVSGTSGANASVVGKVTLKDANSYAVAAAGSTVPEGFTPEDKSIVSTAYYVDNGLFVTVYANKNPAITIYNTVKATKDDAKFKGWSTVDGDVSKIIKETDSKIGSSESVYALFGYDIYKVFVYADTAVDNLYIDGNLMVKGYDNDGSISFTSGDAMLVAGAHTFSYTLKNGYTGNGTFKILSDGKSTVSGNTLTLSGNPDLNGEVVVKLQLTGFTASGYTPVTPVTPSEDKDDGLTITDYLLIVLVVLIVIMAVIVAMRLIRS